MNGIASDSTTGSVIVGVDTHKHLHVAVALDANGVRLAERAVSADSGGYAQLEAWARALERVRCFGIEGTGSYGAGLAGFLRRGGHRVVEVNRADRRARPTTASPTPETPKPRRGRCCRARPPRCRSQLTGSWR